MSDTRWTKEQLEAINARGCNLLVAAAAGAGKTAVLVERIIRRIMDESHPADIDRLLVVTFTNAAATEMKERIAEAISQVLEKYPGSKNIQRQLTLLNKASITTVHSFCLEVIRSNFQNINIDPGFRIADETEASLMKLEALNEFFEDQYEKENGNRDFFELLDCYGGNRDDQKVQDMILNLYNFIQSSPWPQRWLDEMTGCFDLPAGLDFRETRWGRVLVGSAMLELQGLKAMLKKAVDALKQAEGLEKYRAVFAEDLANLEALCQGDGSCDIMAETHRLSWDNLHKVFQCLEFARLPNADKDCDKEIQEYVRKIRDEVKGCIKNLKEKVFSCDSAVILSDMRSMYPVIRCLAQMVSEFGERYKAKKTQKSVVDFNDLEHFCLEILSEQDENGIIRPSQAALNYRERFIEIMVDEYQDSNLVQEIMIGLISRAETGRPNVFMVGDVKQSIYRFRQARPELFLDKYNDYSTDKGEPYRKILLYRNFRSRKEVVDAVNFIFMQIMSVHLGELDYTDTEALNPGAVFPEIDTDKATAGGCTELHIIQTGGDDSTSPVELETEAIEGEGSSAEDDGEQSREMPDNIQCEARFTAKRIRELMQPDDEGRNFCVYDKSGREYRKVEYRDIVVLLRTMQNWSEVFMEELANQGIPAFADTGTGFFKTTEIQVILSLLQLIDNPIQDIPLLSVLRSPIAAFNTDELAVLRLADRKATLYDALRKLAEEDGGKASVKAGRFLKQLDNWRDMSFYMSTDQLLWQLYNDTGYYAAVGAMPAGEQRQANLRILFERARQFEETSYKGLFNFINFIDKLKSSKGDMGSAKILGENDNVVRIMSIHKSKGLEFPVVILAGCGKKFNLQDMNKSILLHQELGFGPDIVDYIKRLSYPSVPKQAVRQKIKIETLSEEMRILYVALTRAREKLIITGTVADIGKAVSKWAQCAGVRDIRLPAYEMQKGARYLDWIGPALLRQTNCPAFRDYAGIRNRYEGLLVDDPSVWDIKIWNKNDIPERKSDISTDENQFNKWLESLESDDSSCDTPCEVTEKLGWKYPYENSSRIPAKVSVTELKRRFDPGFSDNAGELPELLPVLVKKPMFLEEKRGLGAAEEGTALHFVMQHLDYHNSDIDGQIREMTSKDLLTAQQADSISTGKIRRFLESPLGRRAAASGNLNREVPFNIEIPCCEIYKGLDDDAGRSETVLLQGVIDCYFEEPDGIVLLDYKTDYFTPGREDVLRERYRLQIEYYARALGTLTRKKVKEKYIYLFYNGQVLKF